MILRLLKYFIKYILQSDVAFHCMEKLSNHKKLILP
jgi:hypothetical protein